MACLFSNASAFALRPFPLSAGQRGLVTCLDNPSITYDIYLPPAYTSNAFACPIIYTFSPNGGGYISQYQSVCANLQMIAVGIIGSKNGVGYEIILKELHAVTRDIRQRVLFDPTAEIMSGFSGGGIVSYAASRFRPQHVAAVYEMGGTMGRGPHGHPTTDRVQTNLLVARSMGSSDAPAVFYAPNDSNYLASCGAVVKDWVFSGGHQSSPDNIKTLAIQWILNQRSKGAPSDRLNSIRKIAEWKSRISAGEMQTVMEEAIDALIGRPRSWFAYQAQFILDELFDNGDFRSLDVSGLAQGNFAYNHFYFSAYGAALNSDWATYHASLKALTGISVLKNDRAGGVYNLMQQYGFSPAVLRFSESSGQVNLLLTKEAPGLIYAVQSRTNLFNESWQEVAMPVIETDHSWATESGLLPDLESRFYRVKTELAPSTEPVWP